MTRRLNRLLQRPFLRQRAARSPEEVAPDAAVSPIRAGKDVLSDVLRAIKLTGALFFRVDASSPWSVEVPRAEFIRRSHPAARPARNLLPHHHPRIGLGQHRPQAPDGICRRRHSGDPAWGSLRDAQRARMRSGLSHEDSLDFFRAMAAGQLPFVGHRRWRRPRSDQICLRFSRLRGTAVQSPARGLAPADAHPARGRRTGRSARPARSS